jgi:hypothetical protein
MKPFRRSARIAASRLRLDQTSTKEDYDLVARANHSLVSSIQPCVCTAYEFLVSDFWQLRIIIYVWGAGRQPATGVETPVSSRSDSAAVVRDKKVSEVGQVLDCKPLPAD